jgi:hypothetical protein
LELAYEKKTNKAKVKYSGSQLIRFCQMAPLLLFSWLERTCIFRSTQSTLVGDVFDRVGGVVNAAAQLLCLFRLFAISTALVFRNHHERTDVTLSRLTASLIAARSQMIVVWGTDMCNLWNFHVVKHYTKQHVDFGALSTLSTQRPECKHGELKQATKNSAFRDLEQDMLIRSDSMNALEFLAQGGAMHLRIHDYSSEFLSFIQTDPVIQRMVKNMRNHSTYADFEGEEGNAVEDVLDIRIGASDEKLQDSITARSLGLSEDTLFHGVNTLSLPWRPKWVSTITAGGVYEFLATSGNQPYFAIVDKILVSESTQAESARKFPDSERE